MTSLYPAIFLSLGLVAALPAQDDPWARMRALVSGVDLRITTDQAKPALFKLEAVREDAVIVIRKNEMIALPRAGIIKIELRMPGALKRTQAHAQTRVPNTPDGRPNKTTSAGITVHSRDGDYLIIYRRGDPPSKR